MQPPYTHCLFRCFTKRRYYLWIGLLGLLLRIVWALLVPVQPVSDSIAYDTFAQNLANCRNYGWDCHTPTAYWPVGTSFVYSLLYRVFGHVYWPIVVSNLVLDIGTVWLSICLAEKLFGRRVAALSGCFLALWPSQIQFTTVLASEQLFVALTMAGLVIWLNERLNLWLRVGLVGVILAADSYVRPTALLIPVLLLILRFVQTYEVRRNIAAILGMFLLMALLIAPWSIRNTEAFGQFVIISTNGGANLWMGNNPDSTGGFMELPQGVSRLNEAQRDRYLKLLAEAYIKAKPNLFVTRAIQRTIDTYSRESIGVLWNEASLTKCYGTWLLLPLKVINQIYWVGMLVLGISGTILLGIKIGAGQLLIHPTVLFWGYFAAIHAVIVSQDRYHFPSIPMIGILGASAVICLLDAQFKGRYRVNQSFTPK